MNRTWSVFTIPYLVETVVPSTSGSRSRCTPWRETSGPAVSPRLVILSISSRKTMPFCSTFASALARKSSSFTRRAASSSVSIFIASRTFILRSLFLAPPRFWNMPCICWVSSSMPGGANISMCAFGEVAHDRVDVASHIADFGELGRLDLDERRIGEPREAPRDLGLADAGRPDHEDVLGRDLLPQGLGHLLPAPAVPERDRHGALGARLADDVLVQLVNDFLGSHLRHGEKPCSPGYSSTSTAWFWLV